MNLKYLCPISSSQVDENRARINASITVLLLVSFFISLNILVILFLGLDFALRGFGKAAYSPIASIASWLVKTLKLKPKMTNAGPKIFAARIGFVFCLATAITLVIGLPLTATIIASIFALCAFLEAAFGFCVACYIYPFVLKLT